MSQELITIATFGNAVAADLARMRLESRGVQCFLADEQTATMFPQLSHTIGGIRLQVKESHVEKAVAILREKPPAQTGQDRAASDDEGSRCPECNSPDVYYEKYSQRSVFSPLFLTGLPFFFLKRKWRCRECGHQWKAK